MKCIKNFNEAQMWWFMARKPNLIRSILMFVFSQFDPYTISAVFSYHHFVAQLSPNSSANPSSETKFELTNTLTLTMKIKLGRMFIFKAAHPLFSVFTLNSNNPL